MEQEKKNPVVTHLTQVKFFASPEEGWVYDPARTGDSITPETLREAAARAENHFLRLAGAMDLLAAAGFTFRMDRQYLYCFSTAVEAKTAKEMLLKAGYQDREFQIVLEYTRGWGML